MGGQKVRANITTRLRVELSQWNTSERERKLDQIMRVREKEKWIKLSKESERECLICYRRFMVSKSTLDCI